MCSANRVSMKGLCCKPCKASAAWETLPEHQRAQYHAAAALKKESRVSNKKNNPKINLKNKRDVAGRTARLTTPSKQQGELHRRLSPRYACPDGVSNS